MLEQARVKERKSNAGVSGYDAVLLFKMLILQSLYNLSDESMEYQVLDRYACEGKKITPYIAVGREQHNQSPFDRFSEPPTLPENADSVTRMRHRLKTKDGKSIYALRKVTSEPVFGVIKAVMGFRSFLLRGYEAAQGEWFLVCMAYSLKKLHILAG
ncbi:MAG: transposase [Desulfobulbaceae bacterium]|nr:transposase [Desulfobulbaceae bacterium]